MTTYKWKPLTSIKIDPQKAGEELERIRVGHNGRLTQEAVVIAAKSKASPLHDAFEWNDKRAAHQYRLDQASYLIRSITVTIDKQEQAEPVRAFVNVRRDEDRSYTSLAHAMSDDELRRQVVEAAWAELMAWRKRHAELVEMTRIFAVIDETRDDREAWANFATG